MSTMSSTAATATLRYSVFGLFMAGVFAVLLFHQGTVAILHALGIFPNAPFSYNLTAPFGVPQIWSAAFWGGIWGIVFGLVERRFPESGLYWLYAFLFGAILPTLLLAFVVFPLRGIPVAFGWDPMRILIAMFIHGVFGIGIAAMLRWRP